MAEQIHPAGIHVSPDHIELRDSDGNGMKITMKECMKSNTDALLFAVFMKLTEIGQYERSLLQLVQTASAAAGNQASPNQILDQALDRVAAAMGSMPNAPEGFGDVLDGLRKTMTE